MTRCRHSYARLPEERSLVDDYTIGTPRGTWGASRDPRDSGQERGGTTLTRSITQARLAIPKWRSRGAKVLAEYLLVRLVGPTTRARPPQWRVYPNTFPACNTRIPILAIFIIILGTNQFLSVTSVVILGLPVMDCPSASPVLTASLQTVSARPLIPTNSTNLRAVFPSIGPPFPSHTWIMPCGFERDRWIDR